MGCDYEESLVLIEGDDPTTSEVLAFALIGDSFSTNTRRIGCMAVTSNAQGKGYGKKVLEKAIEQIRQSDAAFCGIGVR